LALVEELTLNPVWVWLEFPQPVVIPVWQECPELKTVA
jgi:hypothetical protein